MFALRTKTSGCFTVACKLWINPADSEIHENHFHFLVNSLDEEVALTLAESVELDAEDT
jgi:hypothetical protein